MHQVSCSKICRKVMFAVFQYASVFRSDPCYELPAGSSCLEHGLMQERVDDIEQFRRKRWVENAYTCPWETVKD